MGGKDSKKARRSAASGALPATGATPANSGGGACGGGNPEGPNTKKAKKLDFSKYKNNTAEPEPEPESEPEPEWLVPVVNP